jgi:hypothetical protein
VAPQHRPLVPHPLTGYATEYSTMAPERTGGRWDTDDVTALLTGTDCAPCTAQLTAAAPPVTFAPMAAPAASGEGEPMEGNVVHWAGVIGMEGQMTGDGRMIELNALTWDEGRLPLFFVREDQGFGHAGKLVVGWSDTIERRPGGILWGTGGIELGCAEQCEAARLIGEGLQPGVSMDLDSVSFEIRVKAELLTEEQQIMDDGPAGAAADNPVDEEGRVTVIAIGADDEVMVTTGGRIRGATSVGVPAFAEAVITLTDDDWRDRIAAAMETGDEGMSLVASAAPVAPPAAWFADPGLDQITPITITPDGRVYGHLAQWGTCHTGYPGQCITPPSSPSSYSYFLTGGLLTAEGTEVPVGQITLDTTHARPSASAAQAIEHYEHTGYAVADITVGEDAHGIWFSGGLRPGVTDEQKRILRASPLSGDWRTFRRGGGLELCAALSVNFQGFPVPRPQGLVASGQMQSLVASGMVAPGVGLPRTAPGVPGLSPADSVYLQRLIDRERAAVAEITDEAGRYARRIEAAQLAARIHAH